MTEELKKALESAHTEEEKKAVAEKFKDELRELSPEELEGVAGGSVNVYKRQGNNPNYWD